MSEGSTVGQDWEGLPRSPATSRRQLWVLPVLTDIQTIVRLPRPALPADGRLEFVGMSRTLTAPDAPASIVKNVNLRLFQ